MKRREWMALCARGTGGFLLGACIAPPRQEVDLPDVGDDSETTALPPDYLFGTYEVREDAATAWLSATAACVASFELWTAGAAEPAEVGEVILTAERGYASAYQFEGLEPDKEYRYRAIFDDTRYGPWLRFRTAPLPSEVRSVSFVFSADVGFDAKWFGALEGIVKLPADFYINMGDWPYADGHPAARELDEFRERHRRSRSPLPIQRFMRQFPAFAIYDDRPRRKR